MCWMDNADRGLDKRAGVRLYGDGPASGPWQQDRTTRGRVISERRGWRVAAVGVQAVSMRGMKRRGADRLPGTPRPCRDGCSSAVWVKFKADVWKVPFGKEKAFEDRGH